MIQQMRLTLMADNATGQVVQIQPGPIIKIIISLDFYNNSDADDFYNNSDSDNIQQILSNLTNNNNVETNVKQFFDNYIGNEFDKVLNIFSINDNQILNDIRSILQNNDVKEYLKIGSVKEKLSIAIRENHKLFFNGSNDSPSGKPYDIKEFKEQYKFIMAGIIKVRINEINNIRDNLNNINTSHSQVKQNIQDILTQYINDREQYLNNILEQITSDNYMDDVYQDYVDYYETNDESIVNNHIPIL